MSRRLRPCDECGHVNEGPKYRHTLATHHVVALDRLEAEGGGPLKLDSLNLTRNQWDNFQKLRYFELVRSPKRGLWEITDLGRAWLAGAVQVPHRAWTCDGERIGYESRLVYVTDVLPGYAKAHHYAAGTS